MPVYVFDRALGALVDKATGEPSQFDPKAPAPLPSVQGDYEAYQSPIDGRWIEGKAARREDLKRHGCVDGRDFAPSEPRKLKNKRFIEKHGLQALAER